MSNLISVVDPDPDPLDPHDFDLLDPDPGSAILVRIPDPDPTANIHNRDECFPKYLSKCEEKKSFIRNFFISTDIYFSFLKKKAIHLLSLILI